MYVDVLCCRRVPDGRTICAALSAISSLSRRHTAPFFFILFLIYVIFSIMKLWYTARTSNTTAKRATITIFFNSKTQPNYTDFCTVFSTLQHVDQSSVSVKSKKYFSHTIISSIWLARFPLPKQYAHPENERHVSPRKRTRLS